MPCSRLNSATIQSTTALSKLSPPRWLSPFVAFTSKTPSPELEHRHVEGAAAEVEDEDHLLGALLVEAVRERGRGRLVDDAQHVEAGDAAGVLGRLALRVVEVRGDGDDRVRDRLAEVRLRVDLQLLQDHRADLGRCQLAAVFDAHACVAVLALDDLVGDDRHLLGDLVPLATHEALDREDRVLRVRHLLALGGRPDEPLSVLRERDDGRRGATALRVRDHGGLAALEHGHTGVGRAQVDADCLGHGFGMTPFLSRSDSEILVEIVADHDCSGAQRKTRDQHPSRPRRGPRRARAARRPARCGRAAGPRTRRPTATRCRRSARRRSPPRGRRPRTAPRRRGRRTAPGSNQRAATRGA